MARIYYDNLDDKYKAQDIYKKIIENDNKNLQAHYGLLSIYVWEAGKTQTQKNLDNVETQHYQVLTHEKKKKDRDKERLTELAELYINFKTDRVAQKDDLYNKAEDTIHKILEVDKKYDEAYYQYARLYRSRKDPVNAEATITRAISLKPRAKYYNFLGELYLIENKLNLAIEAFDEGFDSTDKDQKSTKKTKAKINYNLGNINYYDLENYGEALRNYNDAVNELGDEYYDLNYNLGWLYYNSLDYENANKFFNKAKEILDRDNPLVNFALGNTYKKAGKYDLAAAEYLNAVDFFKEKYGEYPKVNLANKELVEAMKMLSAIYNNLGVCYVNQNDEKKALAFFWKAVESAKKLGFSNENPEARANIQYVLQSKEVVKEPMLYNEIKKKIIDEPYEKIPF